MYVRGVILGVVLSLVMVATKPGHVSLPRCLA